MSDSTGLPMPAGGSLEMFEYHGTTVRTMTLAGEPWFVLGDLCTVLDITRGPSNVLLRLDPDGVRPAYPILDSLGRTQHATIVNEAAMYEVVIRSDKPVAAEFRRWLTHDVLPAIRKTGSYAQVPALSGSELLAHAVIEAQAMITAKDARIAELEPKAQVADRFLDADGDLSVADAAKSLTRTGIQTGERRLFTELQSRGWIYRAPGAGHWCVYQRFIECGWMSVIPKSHYHPKTGVLALDPPQPRVTPKGLQRLAIILDARTEGIAS